MKTMMTIAKMMIVLLAASMVAQILYLSGELDELQGKVYKSRVFNEEACIAHGLDFDKDDWHHVLECLPCVIIEHVRRDYWRVLSGFRPATYSPERWQAMYGRYETFGTNARPAPTLLDLTPIGIIPPFEHPVWSKLLEDWNAHHYAPQLANTDYGHAMVWPNTWLKAHDEEQYDRACKIISATAGLYWSSAMLY
jgi:hypothetical protein